ncbi:restriction endonuclease subunit S [Myroides odoratimimus]|nr:restriction endonuclease subunit S [Myroides odoratimimus]
MEWKKEKFNKLISHKSGYTWSKDQEVNKPEPNTIRVLTVSNIQQELDLSSELYLHHVSEKDKIEKAVSKGWSIAVSSNGNRKRIGNAIYINQNTDYLFASFLTAFKPKDGADIDSEFFYRWLTSETIQERISTVSEGTTGLGNLDLRFLRQMEIYYPESKFEQKAITTILSKIDEAIETTKQSIRAAEKLKKVMMQNLLTGKLKPDGTWRKEEDFYIDEKFGKIPKSWNFKKIKDVFDVNLNSLSSQTNPDFSFNYITIENVSTEVIDFENCVNYKFKDSPGRARRNLKNGDILISGVRPNLKSFAIYENPNNENWICSTGFYILSAKENQDKEFYFYQILSSIGEKQFYSYVAGSNYPAIGDRDLKNMIIYSPGFDEQIEISKKFKILADTISEKQIKIKSLEKLKKSLMQHLLTGKKRLSNEAIKKINQN